MLGLLNKKSGHPMSDIKSAQMLLLDLPKNDALKSLHEVSAWIESSREQDEFRLDHQFEVLRMLDETARQYERKLMREYYTAVGLSLYQENRLWMALNAFSTQILLAYLNVQVRYRNGDKGAAAIKEMMPLIAARGINAVTGMLKSAAARHALFDQAIWASLAEFYAHAEEQNYLDEPVALYNGAGGKTSVRSEFGTALMWYASSFGTLARLPMHLAERLISHLGSNFTVSAQHEPGSLFSFDLEYPMSPMRLATETSSSPSLRFIGVGTFQPQIDALLKTLEKNLVPEGVNLGGTYEAKDLHIAARHLAERLKFPPPKRRSKRHNVKVSLSVANGFSGIMEQSIGLNFGSNDSQVWQVEDISVSGIRCILPASAANGVVVGSLVGIKPEKMEHWGVGIVRRLNCDPKKNLHVGIEMLANQVIGVGVRERDADEASHALWLDNPGGDAGEVDLLMSPDIFTSSRSLHTQVEGRKYLLMPLKLVERGADYDLARYRKVEEDSRPD